MGGKKIYTIESISVTIDEALDTHVTIILTRTDEMTLTVTPEELFVMLG